MLKSAINQEKPSHRPVKIINLFIGTIVLSAIFWSVFLYGPRRNDHDLSRLRNIQLCLPKILYERAPNASAQAAYISIDIGHSNLHPGATSARGKPEFQFNRDLANAIDKTLRDASFKTNLSNSDGKTTDLMNRVNLPKDADFLISIHHDSVQPKYLSKWHYAGVAHSYSDRYKGYALFVSRLNPYLSKSLVCASALGNSLKTHGFEPSRYHAESIPGENRPFADEKNGVHYFDRLAVLKHAPVPAILFEAGVIVNRGEEVRLEANDTRQAIAAAVAEGLQACLCKVDCKH